MSAPLPPIPVELTRLTGRVEFRSHDGAWHLVGPAELLPVGRVVSVRRWSTGTAVGRVLSRRWPGRRPHDGGRETVEVLVTAHVAERVVRHRAGSYTRDVAGRESTRFVLATFDRPPRVDEPSLVG